MEITLKNISYRYKNKRILDKINIKIEDNSITGITGECKTLLCEIIDAVKNPSSGNLFVGDIELTKNNIKTIRKEVCMIHQNYQNQFFTDDVKEEIMFLVSRLNYQPKDINKKMKQSLKMVGLNDSYLDKSIHTLSIGEKKLLQVAIGLICNPSIIIFDEVFSELDLISTKRIIKLIRMLKEKYNKTIIISSNDINLLYEITDNIIVLKKGNVIISGKTVSVCQDVELLKSNGVEVPDLVMFTYLAKNKKVKLSYHRDIRDLIKDVYKHV